MNTHTRKHVGILGVLFVWLDESIIRWLAEEILETFWGHGLASSIDETKRCRIVGLKLVDEGRLGCVNTKTAMLNEDLSKRDNT